MKKRLLKKYLNLIDKNLYQNYKKAVFGNKALFTLEPVYKKQVFNKLKNKIILNSNKKDQKKIEKSAYIIREIIFSIGAEIDWGKNRNLRNWSDAYHKGLKLLKNIESSTLKDN